ncbi:class I SAM-dependent methyltransferase [Algoriphagus sp. AK58]|uniref:class I SAM-dependent methyltransferase n=1 Tax=Algoriphagus sp. AK58 TaxID=1406877 RepID=UPI0016502D1B|nr:class I SAM-dependent methyltransferase [Algoriphagus sp. AK58]MBC6365725.1 class I SAM-dependent methyltransferase [Algoriphagus sp. AK58]
MRQITCPVCFTSSSQSPPALSRVKCSSCGVIWTFIPEQIDSEKLYRDEVYAVVDNRQSIFEKIIFSEAKKVLNQARSINPKASNLLDFGSGKGQFLAMAKAQGWKGIGIETEKARADFARDKYGVEVRCEYYQGGKILEKPADLLALNHVLEHLPQPMVLLEKLVESNLSSNGLLYIEVPRADSWQANIAGNHWMHWDIPKHLTHWTEPVLVGQLEKLGFSLVGKREYSVHLGVLGMLQGLLSSVGFRENLILRLKRKKTLGLVLLIGATLPFAWILEVLSVGFGKSGVMGLYFRKKK